MAAESAVFLRALLQVYFPALDMTGKSRSRRCNAAEREKGGAHD